MLNVRATARVTSTAAATTPRRTCRDVIDRDVIVAPPPLRPAAATLSYVRDRSIDRISVIDERRFRAN